MSKGRGRFVTFEGIDGAGKSTQLAAVARRLAERGIDHVVTREPGGTALGEALRELVLREPMTARAETLLMFAARAEHIESVIEPALSAGRWVICDRFTDATYAYQGGGRQVPEAQIAALEQWVHPQLQPDLSLLFDIEPGVAAARLTAARTADRFESERAEFFERVRKAYLMRARRHARRFIVFDGSLAPEDVGRQVLEAIDRWLS